LETDKLLENRSENVKTRMKKIPGWLLRYGIIVLTIIVGIILFLSTKIEFTYPPKRISNLSITSNTELSFANTERINYKNISSVQVDSIIIPIQKISLSPDGSRVLVLLPEHDQRIVAAKKRNAFQINAKKNLLELIFKEFL